MTVPAPVIMRASLARRVTLFSKGGRLGSSHKAWKIVERAVPEILGGWSERTDCAFEMARATSRRAW